MDATNLSYPEQLDKKENHESPDQYMTDDQKLKGRYYADLYATREGEDADIFQEWDEIEDLYAGYRVADADPKFPNSFFPLITPIVEGQVAAMMDSNTEYSYSSRNPTHQTFIKYAEAAGEFIRTINKADRQYKDYARRWVNIGNAMLKVSWEDGYGYTAGMNKGYPRISTPDPRDVLIDGSIKDYKDLQNSAYIIEVVRGVRLSWAKERYGKEKASAIFVDGEGSQGTFGTTKYDDLRTFTMLLVWTRDNDKKNLQLLEVDKNGFLLKESNPAKPYHMYVNNEYPYYLGRGMPIQGSIYGRGDGHMIKPAQIYLNRLFDELEISARFNAQPKTYIDFEKSNIDLDEYDSDPSHPIGCENPTQNVYAAPPPGISPVIYESINLVINQVQRFTRFSDIMTGNQQGVSATATQINGQLQQGAVGINDKKADIIAAMEWAERYSLNLCLEHWKKPFWAGLGSESRFVDMQTMTEIDETIPKTDQEVYDLIMSDNPPAKITGTSSIKKDGKNATGKLNCDIKITLGNAFPRGKFDLYNQIMGLLQTATLNPATNQQDTVMTLSKAREELEKIMGMDMLTTEEKATKTPTALPEVAIPGGANPIAANGGVALPTGTQVGNAENMQSTVPMTGPMDKRGIV